MDRIDLTPDPYLSTSYRPGWAPRGVDVTAVYPRDDLVWLDRQWALTREGRSGPDIEPDPRSLKYIHG